MSAVVVFHFFPTLLPGGYVGVDVFFVISGYLITGHLVREITARGSIRLRLFWARRILRLLPAAFTVLVISAFAVLIFFSESLWTLNLTQLTAAAFYVFELAACVGLSGLSRVR